MKKIINAALATILAMAFASPASAAVYICSGTVTAIGLGADGAVLVAVGSLGPFGMCNIDATNGVITAQNCRGWLSQLMTAKALGSTVYLHLNTADTPNGDLTGCNPSEFNWVGRRPYYIETR